MQTNTKFSFQYLLIADKNISPKGWESTDPRSPLIKLFQFKSDRRILRNTLFRMYVLGNYTKSVAQSFLEINTLGIAVKCNYPKE